MKVLINTKQTYVAEFSDDEAIAFIQEFNEKGDIKDEKQMKKLRYYLKMLAPVIMVQEIKEV